MDNVLTWQWILLGVSSIILFIISPKVSTNEGFFSGIDKKKHQPGFAMLTMSLFISWIFAKSITNAANLGLSFGIVGGLSYAMYYFSFLVAGIVIYKIRKHTNVKSLHEFLRNKFGRTAIIMFSVVISIRLLNEVWSNTAVIGTYFGETGSTQYIISIIVFTLLTLAYSLKGGLRSSLITDMIQTILFAVLLAIVLIILIPKQGSVTPFITSGEWSMSMGLNLFFVAIIQVFSYPFHDPVLTDRGFISDNKTTLKSFIGATVLGFLAILLFSFVGIYGKLIGVSGQAAVEVSKTLSIFTLIVMNFIMITSAASTLDSTFSSVSKLAVVDLAKKRTPAVSTGRWVMIITAVGGTIPLFFTPEILSATTISGTMVLGLAPIFIFWKIDAPKISFQLAIWAGIICGIILTLGLFPKSLYLTEGKYADLLSINIYGTIIIFILYFIPIFYNKLSSNSISS
jgi:Na+/proline symporter